MFQHRVTLAVPRHPLYQLESLGSFSANPAQTRGLQRFGKHMYVAVDVILLSVHHMVYESRAETHERFYIIEVHRHRFEMSARKVPFEKCTRWRKVCGRSAKDQIGDSIYFFFFFFFLRFRAKGSRKARERCAKDVSTRAMSCPKWAAFSHAWYWSKGKEATYHNDILVASIHSCKQQPIYCIVCIRVCLIPYESWAKGPWKGFPLRKPFGMQLTVSAKVFFWNGERIFFSG